MADVKKKGFKTLEKSYEEIEEQIREHRSTILKRVLQTIGIIVALIIGVELFYALRSFNDYEIKDEIERKSSASAQYQMFGNYLLEYSNDGISCISSSHEIVWNQSFEMASPKV